MLQIFTVHQQLQYFRTFRKQGVLIFCCCIFTLVAKAQETPSAIPESFAQAAMPTFNATDKDTSQKEQPSSELENVVVVGYGKVSKKDLTGNTVSISSKDLQRGSFASPEQMLNGKVAGLQITPGGGSPGAGATIRIRGGASLNASNTPLIVIDDVPVSNDGISGVSNPLSMINPNDIETFTILKDASATAIYGSRASNGVIIITTKKGKDVGGGGNRFLVDFLSTQSFVAKTKSNFYLNANEYQTFINGKGSDAQKSLLGTANTDWQDAVLRNAFSTDNNLSLTGKAFNTLIRFSLGAFYQDGILIRDNFQRYSAGINASRKFLHDALKIDVNTKFVYGKSFFANQSAIGNSLRFDPTQSILDPKSPYGGYYEWTNIGNLVGATLNPLGVLNQEKNIANSYRTLNNIQLDYKVPFVSGLRLNLNAGIDFSLGNGTQSTPYYAASNYATYGYSSSYTGNSLTRLFDVYLNYVKEITAIKSKIDVTAGHSYQKFDRNNQASIGYNQKEPPTEIFRGLADSTELALLSFFGRLNYTVLGRYLLTLTLRADGSSRFAPDKRWGLFPSAALAWKLHEEKWMQQQSIFNVMKLRLSYGITGQQDINSFYPYVNAYQKGSDNTRYVLGGVPTTIQRPVAYDPNIQWEETATANAGLDIEINKGQFVFALDVYQKNTNNLLAEIDVPAGSNLSNRVSTNIGTMRNRGVELFVNAVILKTQNLKYSANFNMTYNQSEIVSLSRVASTSAVGNKVGGIAGGKGNTIQVHTAGYTPFSFYVQQQVYDKSGKPIEGVYVDRNGDGIVDDKDLYRTHSPMPKFLLGLSNSLEYENWSASFTLRANFGNYVYNNARSATSMQDISYDNRSLNNLNKEILNTGFKAPQLLSDYFLENASFLRMDNISVGYNFGNTLYKKVQMRLGATIQNVFVITKYSGADPEIFNGIDNNLYPRPTTYSVQLSLNF